MFSVISRKKTGSAKRLKIASKLSILLGIVAVLDGCKPHHSVGDSEAYIENGRIWAYGQVQLTGLDDDPQVLIKRNAPVDGLDSSSQSEFSLLGTIDQAEMKEFAYVDYHPQLDRVLAYHYSVEFAHRYDGNYDIWGVLRKGGRSYYNRQKVYLGMGTIADGAETGTVALAQGLRISAIVSGVFSGQWAFHYPDIKRIIIRPWSGMCAKSVTQQPGQAPGQNPGQAESCRPMPKEHDLCNGDPTQAGCRPLPPVQQPMQQPIDNSNPPVVSPVPSRVFTGLDVISADDQVFSLSDSVKTAKIVFKSENLATASADENAAFCASQFLAVGRTINRQVNESCVLKPAPAEPQDGKMTCAVTVSFEQAQTYMENVCNITAVFRGDSNESQVVQVLRKQ